MSDFKFKLQPYKGKATRQTCPKCNKANEFSLYIDMETAEPLADHVGRCNREDSCGYTYRPKDYFEDNGIKPQYPADRQQPQAMHIPVSFIDADALKKSLTGYDSNNFVHYLNSLFGADIGNELIQKYHIGSSKRWPGAVVFWQIDLNGKIRTGKIMQYNPATGHRTKEPGNLIDWVHTCPKTPDFNLQSCCFGEHLIKDKSKPIAIVESEKTAIIASVYLPQFIWISVSGKNGLNDYKCSRLKGYDVILYPDLEAYDLWSKKAAQYRFMISDLLERKATAAERQAGLDLADYLVKFKVSDFINYDVPVKINPEAVERSTRPEQDVQVENQPMLDPIYLDKYYVRVFNFLHAIPLGETPLAGLDKDSRPHFLKAAIFYNEIWPVLKITDNALFKSTSTAVYLPGYENSA